MNEISELSREGLIETGRSLDYYTWDLFFEPDLLAGKKVLNLGSGSSNLGKDLARRKIECDVFDLDLSYDPYVSRSIKPFRTKIAQMVDKYMTGGDKRQKIRKIMGIEDRKMTQADMGILPFVDRSIDVIMALYSTYQIPTDKKRQVFKEMLRVSDAVHICPILKEDLYLFIDLINNEYQDFRIVVCYPPADQLLDNNNRFIIKEEADYKKILDGEMGEDTVYEPIAEKVEYRKNFMGYLHATVRGGYTIILKRIPILTYV